MIVEDLINRLKTLPQNLPVVMPDIMPITDVILDKNYGGGVVVITDYEIEKE